MDMDKGNANTLYKNQQNPIQLEKPSPEAPEKPQSEQTKHRNFRGPFQDDSTFRTLCGLRTIPARLLIWYNLPLCWILGVGVFVLGWLDEQLRTFSPETRRDVAVLVAVSYIVYAIFAHTVGVFGALVYELWRNPYARAPSLVGEVGPEEEVAMLLENRAIVRRFWPVRGGVDPSDQMSPC